MRRRSDSLPRMPHWSRATKLLVTRFVQAVRKRQRTALSRLQRFDARIRSAELARAWDTVEHAERVLQMHERGERYGLTRHEVRRSQGDIRAARQSLRQAKVILVRCRMSVNRRARAEGPARLASEIRPLCEHPRVRAVWVNRGCTELRIYLDTVTIRYRRHQYEIGDFCLVCSYCPLHYKALCLRSNNQYQTHPHGLLNRFGGVCFGDASFELQSFLWCGNYVALVDLAMHQLEQRAPGHTFPSHWRKIP